MVRQPQEPNRQQLEQRVIQKIKTMSDEELKRLAGGIVDVYAKGTLGSTKSRP